MRHDGKAFGFKERRCPECQKTFLPAAYHRWDDEGILLCTYTCYMRRLDKKKPKVINGKYVEQYTPRGVYVATYRSAVEAAEAVGVVRANNIRECCAGKCKTSGGYIWRYKKEETSSDAVESLG